MDLEEERRASARGEARRIFWASGEGPTRLLSPCRGVAGEVAWWRRARAVLPGRRNRRATGGGGLLRWLGQEWAEARGESGGLSLLFTLHFLFFSIQFYSIFTFIKATNRRRRAGPKVSSGHAQALRFDEI